MIIVGKIIVKIFMLAFTALYLKTDVIENVIGRWRVSIILACLVILNISLPRGR